MFLSEGREMIMKEFFIPLADGKRVFARYYNEQKKCQDHRISS